MALNDEQHYWFKLWEDVTTNRRMRSWIRRHGHWMAWTWISILKLANSPTKDGILQDSAGNAYALADICDEALVDEEQAAAAVERFIDAGWIERCEDGRLVVPTFKRRNLNPNTERWRRHDARKRQAEQEPTVGSNGGTNDGPALAQTSQYRGQRTEDRGQRTEDRVSTGLSPRAAERASAPPVPVAKIVGHWNEHFAAAGLQACNAYESFEPWIRARWMSCGKDHEERRRGFARVLARVEQSDFLMMRSGRKRKKTTLREIMQRGTWEKIQNGDYDNDAYDASAGTGHAGRQRSVDATVDALREFAQGGEG